MFPFEWDTSIKADPTLYTITWDDSKLSVNDNISAKYMDIFKATKINLLRRQLHACWRMWKEKRFHADWLKDGVHLLYKNRLEGWNRTIFIDHRNFVSHTGNVCSDFSSIWRNSCEW